MNQADLQAQPWQLSERARKLTSSAIREILKVTERPEVISFAGGLPSPATFPVEEMRVACERILRDSPAAALQYSATEGYLPLREWVAQRYSVNGASVRASQVLITTGSQQALDLLGKVLIDPASRVLVETPTYLGALQSFSMYEPNYVQVPTDEHGLIPEALNTTLTADASCTRSRFPEPDWPSLVARTPDGARRVCATCRVPGDRRRSVRRARLRRYAAADHAFHGAGSHRASGVVFEGVVAGHARGLHHVARECTSNSSRPNKQPTCIRRASHSASCMRS